ncbi:MAG: hypothetical protein AAGD22_07395 [Verrucomicrobiota bacterium]
MNLRDQLRQILPEILSENPTDAIKGTELIRLVKFRLNHEYSDATLRYHFSIMSCDPTSPIAKVEHGQGYYNRTSTNIHSLKSARNLIPTSQGLLGEEFRAPAEEVDLALARANKFREIFCRHNEYANRLPFSFEKSFSEGELYQNLWRFPDAVLLDWHVAEAVEEEFSINPDLLEMCRHTGGSPFSLTAVKMKLDVDHGSFREDFFQCLSNSAWTHGGELVIAAPIADEKLAESLRSLGAEFGIGIESWGLDIETLDDLPEAAAIRVLKAREFEAIQSKIAQHRLCSPTPRTGLAWPEFLEMRQESADFEEIVQWLTRSLKDQHPYSYHQFRQLNAPSHSSAHEVVA